jgi:hypothetical protein
MDAGVAVFVQYVLVQYVIGLALILKFLFFRFVLCTFRFHFCGLFDAGSFQTPPPLVCLFTMDGPYSPLVHNLNARGSHPNTSRTLW